ncbi:hypothetical protein [Clostridium celatum]|uniref:Uncharacterized protein n=1 Tax=Clostridium celatum DSM 1785 TaxID=545697 RepID=L1QF16_9CLOT|nr:hypothetical protein [Clostridium celatum]EKY26589.1 hypothetical protein HMPREF0216_01774 [Clostridium celatum DSM 1785]
MSKGKRELIIEIGLKQLSIPEIRKELDNFLKEAGVKYSEDVKFYFNVDSKTVYVVTDKTNFEVKLWN